MLIMIIHGSSIRSINRILKRGSLGIWSLSGIQPTAAIHVSAAEIEESPEEIQVAVYHELAEFHPHGRLVGEVHSDRHVGSVLRRGCRG